MLLQCANYSNILVQSKLLVRLGLEFCHTQKHDITIQARFWLLCHLCCSSNISLIMDFSCNVWEIFKLMHQSRRTKSSPSNYKKLALKNQQFWNLHDCSTSCSTIASCIITAKMYVCMLMYVIYAKIGIWMNHLSCSSHITMLEISIALLRVILCCFYQLSWSRNKSNQIKAPSFSSKK